MIYPITPVTITPCDNAVGGMGCEAHHGFRRNSQRMIVTDRLYGTGACPVIAAFPTCPPANSC